MNRKGFTLTELLVVVVILGIITGLSIPLIRSLSTTFENKKYNTYADTVLQAAKLYNNSYSEDLFGRKEYGCSYITYEQLSDKNLLKDINIERVSCNTDQTIVRIIKQKDKYGYSDVVGCGRVDSNGHVSNIKRYPEGTTIPIDHSSCTGAASNNIGISVDDRYIGGEYDKKKKTTKILLSSGTGINNHISIKTAWSTDPNGFDSATDWTKAGFEIKGDQEKKLLNGELIEVSSNQISTPSNKTGDYYLLVKVDELVDLYGSKWVNNLTVGGIVAAVRDNYISYGPFKIDNDKPTIKVDIYKCGEDEHKTGDIIVSKTATGSNNNVVITTQDITGADEKWLNSETFPKGACLDLTVTDGVKVEKIERKWNSTNLSANATNYKNLTNEDEVSVNAKTATKTTAIKGSGHRYSVYTAKDYVGHRTSIIIDMKLDNKVPTCGEATVTKLTKNISLPCTDEGGSGCIQNPYTMTYSGNNEIENIEISDNALNKKVCPVEVAVDMEPPKVKLEIFKCSSTHVATGSAIKTFNVTEDTTIHSSDIISGWFNYSNYPYGVCLKYTATDDIELKGADYGYNNGGFKENQSGYNTLSVTSSQTYSGETGIKEDWFAGNGHRYIEYTAIDQKDKTTKVTLDLKIDSGSPSCSTSKSHQGYASGVDVSVSCSDSVSGVASCPSGGRTKSNQSYTVTDNAGNTGSCSVKITTSSCACNSTCYYYRTCKKKDMRPADCNKLRDNKFSQVGYDVHSGVGDCIYSCETYACGCSTCYS